MGTEAGVEIKKTLLDGKPFQQINPDNASHTFAIPQLGVLVPLEGVPDNAKNQCGFAPCDPKSMAVFVYTGSSPRFGTA